MKKKSCFIATMLLVMSIFVTACAKEAPKAVVPSKPSVQAVEQQKTEEARLAKEKEEKLARQAALQEQFKLSLDGVMNSLPKNGTDYSVYVYAPELDATYMYNNKPMGSASMIKVFILEKAFAEIAKGNLNEEATLVIESDTRVGGAGSLQGYGVGTPIKISTLLHKMIVESDNTATNMLIKHFGMENINSYMREHGYTESLLCRRMMDYESLRAGRDNVASAKDLGMFFKKIYLNQAVGTAYDQKMIAILKQQDDTDKIPVHLPAGTAVAHKTGEINAVMNDGGIVYTRHPYVLVILTDNAPGYQLAINQVADLAGSINTAVHKFIDEHPAEAAAPTPAQDKAEVPVQNAVATPAPAQNKAEVPVQNAAATPAPVDSGIIDKPVVHNDRKKQLQKEYSLKHYGADYSTITPQAVVVHWTASNIMTSAFNWFNHEEYGNAPGTLNVGSQFIVDRDGSIYRIMPETTLARHAIGYNWCAIGIENVGGENHQQNLTEAQLNANIKLISYLAQKYPTIKYVWGHYQQDKAKASGLYKELVSSYYSGKDDPGAIFMSKLRQTLQPQGLSFFQE